MIVREKEGVFDYQSGQSQGILIHVLGMNPDLDIWQEKLVSVNNQDKILPIHSFL